LVSQPERRTSIKGRGVKQVLEKNNLTKEEETRGKMANLNE
jgi:hypothetical protein